MSRAAVAILAIAFSLTGCGTSKPARFYSLNSTSVSGPAAPLNNIRIMIGPVSIPASVDQPQYVTQPSSNRVEVDEYNRWAAPLDENIARAVAGDLSNILGAPTVATRNLANFNPDYVVTIDVQRFESVKGQAASLDAVWAVRKIASGETISGRSSVREAAEGSDYDALSSAHSRALAKLSDDIAVAIRSAAVARANST